MAAWRQTSTAAALAATVLLTSTAAQQRPTLETVLERSASYVAAFRRQLAGLAAEESYTQQVANTSRFTDSLRMMPTRRLKSDLLLIRAPGGDRYVELRDVYEVDGAPVRDRQSRLEDLLRDGSVSADAQIGKIINESARYNIGAVTRNINTPLMALQFLDAAQQPRFRFRHVDKAKPVFGTNQDHAANDAAVFRVTAEMWTIEYRERDRNTIIRKPDGSSQPSHGRFWINPEDGSVLISELIVDGGGVLATVTVSYQTEPLMGFLVPVEMRESYVGKGERIIGEASYGKFRQIAR